MLWPVTLIDDQPFLDLQHLVRNAEGFPDSVHRHATSQQLPGQTHAQWEIFNHVLEELVEVRVFKLLLQLRWDDAVQ